VPGFKMAAIGQNPSHSEFLDVQCATARIPPQFSEFLFVGLVARCRSPDLLVSTQSNTRTSTVDQLSSPNRSSSLEFKTQFKIRHNFVNHMPE
jgi:hypothetical protein